MWNCKPHENDLYWGSQGTPDWTREFNAVCLHLRAPQLAWEHLWGQGREEWQPQATWEVSVKKLMWFWCPIPWYSHEVITYQKYSLLFIQSLAKWTFQDKRPVQPYNPEVLDVALHSHSLRNSVNEWQVGGQSPCRALANIRLPASLAGIHKLNTHTVLRPFCLERQPPASRDTSLSWQSTPFSNASHLLPPTMPSSTLTSHRACLRFCKPPACTLLSTWTTVSALSPLQWSFRSKGRRLSYLCSPFRALPTMYAQVLLNSVD